MANVYGLIACRSRIPVLTTTGPRSSKLWTTLASLVSCPVGSALKPDRWINTR
ncbi:hypothetical protein PILCRDRAFT_821792 [Piloderma croceum F 1598]|uniref:Uncharacterized protein n=1 Tax=Piloderma croceum (strain F 1598) TaxID=765440 RepID=A0A0C3F9J3_PILCF|nr:hypothetical protein PILCRDRAFT_821792 [Piloderma croceum F 1598]